MRYQLWDALVFPAKSRIPLQEFKASCHVVPGPSENFNLNPSTGFIPTVTAFVPALSAGSGFRISVHSWNTPEVSRFTQSYSNYSDDVMYEARVYVDGRLVGTKYFTRNGNDKGDWPVVIDTSLEVDKHGDLEPLIFPEFHRELLAQSYWNASDDYGRIKVVIAEGFQRCSMTAPFERIKNLVAFSFQHAPIEVLETSSIAWPNPNMWRQVPYAASYLQYPARQPSTDFEAHGHSPRQKTRETRTMLPPPAMGPIVTSNDTILPKPVSIDPFYEPGSSARPWRQASTSDVSMPDYTHHVNHTSHGSRASDSRMPSDSALTVKTVQAQRHENLSSNGAFDAVCEALLPAVPVNTPADVTPSNAQSKKRINNFSEDGSEDFSDLSLRPIVFPCSIKGRKENLDLPTNQVPAVAHPVIDGVRKTAQPFTPSISSNNKRQRVITPASFKAIDEEDEPRSSPISRIGSRGHNQNGTHEPRRTLGDLQNLA